MTPNVQQLRTNTLVIPGAGAREVAARELLPAGGEGKCSRRPGGEASLVVVVVKEEEGIAQDDVPAAAGRAYILPAAI